MFQDRTWLVTRVAVVFLLAAGVAAAAEKEEKQEEKNVPWHVKNAELRVPVEVAVNNALLRMPPQVYLADLKPLKTSGGLAFDPLTKSAIRRDVRKPKEKAATIAKEKERYKKAKTKWDPKAYGRLQESKGGPIMRVTGSATYAIRPEYKYFSCWSALYPESKIFIDGKPVRHSNVVTIPAGAKTLKIEARDSHLRQAGFITRSPRVTHSAISLPGHDPTRLVPVVHRASGQRVGCRTVWAEAGEPMSIMFDSSSGDHEYWVYLVDQAKKPARLDWAPQAELIEEVRQLDRYDPELETLAGFEKLWESAATFGRGVSPNQVIYEGTVQFRSKAADGLNFAQLARSQPVKLKRISGIFQIPATSTYRLFCMNGPGGYVLLDGQLIATFRGAKIARLFEMEIDQGEHRLEFLQYSPMGQVGWAALWWKDPTNKDYNGEYSSEWPSFGQSGYKLWEPRADATPAPLEYRTTGSRASFRWYHSGHLWAVSPGHDLNWYRFSAHAPGASTEAVYRWRFDDGRTAEGKEVMKLFLRPGMRKVQLEVQDAPGGKVIARAAGEVNVQLNLANWRNFSIKHDNRASSPLQEMMWAFMEEDKLEQLPLDDLVNLYEWSFPLKHWRASWMLHDGEGVPDFARVPLARREAHDLARRQVGDMLARRVDEVIDAYPYSQLLQIAQSFTRTVNGPNDVRYAAAEKLLATVLERAPAGSSHWRTAALALSDIKLSVRGETEFAASLLEKFSETEPAVDRLERWQFAEAREYHHVADTDKLAPLTAGLEWSPIQRPRHPYGPEHRGLTIPFKNNRGFWLARDFDLPADWKGNDLVFHAGLPPGAQLEHVWMNGQPLGRMWQWYDENIVIPAKLLKKGGKNRITWLLQPFPWSQQVQRASPTVSADLSHTASSHDDRIQLVKGRHLRQDLGQLLVVGVLHDTPRSLAFSADGKQLASGHQYGSVRLWDVDGILEGKEGSLEPLKPGAKRRAFVHTGISIGAVSIVSLAFSADGKRLAAGSEDYRITLLDPASGQTIRSFIGHAADVVALAFSPDGKRLASASHDRTVKIWDSSTGKQLLTLAEHAGPVHAVAYSPDGKSIATAIDNAHIRLWDATTGKPLRTLEGQQGQVLSLAFSPDGKRLAAGYREAVVSQWDLASGKKLTTSRHGAEQGYQDSAIIKVLYSLDGKQLVSLGGGSARKWNSETGSGGEQFGQFDAPRIPQSLWHGPGDGPNRLADGFENFPVELYTTKACQEQGMNYASYYGKWDELPDFDALKPVKQGVLRQIDKEHLKGILLPYHKTIKKDGKDHRTQHPSALKVTGYLKVKKAGDYTFSLQSADGCQLVVGSKTVIDNQPQENPRESVEVKHGTVHLEPGVHPVVLSYLNARGVGQLNVVFPTEFVRSLTVGDIASSRLLAGALLAQGKPEEAKALLIKLHRGGWPLSEEEYRHVEQARMRIRRMARTTSTIDHGHALGLIDTSLATHPMLRLDPEFMVSVIAVYASMGDPRAAILAEQMLEAEMNDGQRRLLIMTQVKIKLNAGDLPGAGEVYRRLKKLAPQSDETIEARELIKAAVIKG